MPDLFRHPSVRKLYTVAHAGRCTPEQVRGDDGREGSYLPLMADLCETELILDPKFDAVGLVTAVVTDRGGAPLMVAHMNAEALRLSIETREAHFWSRSRRRLWKKGETSGNVLRIIELRVDCDQDAVWVIADPAGPACHTGAVSCFYRRIEGDRLVPIV